jgi:Na+/proline symporter
MNFGIDVAIFIAFLAGNLIFGLWASRGVDTLRGYAIGDKNFSTATLVATIVATFASGEYFFTIVSEAYASGIGFIYTALVGEVLSLFLIGRLFAPRMAEFLGSLSIAEAMGGLYGNNVRIITSISGFIGVAGIIAVQLKIAGILFEYALGVEPTYGVISAGILITFYSSLGGIKSVTLTDIVQFATFGVVIPVISYYLLGSIENNQVIIDTLTTNPVFDYKTIFSFSNPQIYYYITLFVWCAIPSFDPAIFQRVAMARDIKQVGSSFLMASFVCMLLIAILSWIGILVLSSHPNMPETEIFKFILTNSNSFAGFKGIILIGIMAMVMSTVDSYINSSAVLIAHDLRHSLNIPFIKNELLATRIGSMLIGTVAILFAMRQGSFIELFIWASMFYMPVVSVPFILAILGFRSSAKAVLISIAGGFFTAIIWESFFKINGVGGLVPGVFANIIFLFASHYLLKQKGGWVGIKDPTPLLERKEERKQQCKKLWQQIKLLASLL